MVGFDPRRVERREPLSEHREPAASATRGGSTSRRRRALRRFCRNRSAMFGLIVVVGMSLLAIFARPIVLFGVPVQPFSIAPHDPTAILYLQEGYTDVGRYDPPSLAHPMGTDGSGRDVFSRVIYGGRYSISIGVVVVALTASVGMIYGSIAGYYGGWLDEIMMRVVDVIFAFPSLVLALLLVAMLGGGYWQLVAAFSLVGWATYARLIRGEVLAVKENEYVLAARAIGARDRTVIVRHVVPNAVAPLLVQASLSIGTVVIGVAALGFLGIGMEPGTPEWGTMLDDTRETLIGGGGAIPWWATVFPGAAIFLFVLATNLVGDGISDALDARVPDESRRGGGG
ncbi:ABC transporter permease [Halobacteria archaeon AArc-dxtr1]|nr:ABC transporter permease [Halobacteria archaeon AArc-dxtr1]